MHHSLHVPVGKLRNDRYIPLHPTLVDLIADLQTTNAVHIARAGRLLSDETSNVDRHRVCRMVRRIAKNAGIGQVHPHQLRHTVAAKPSIAGCASNLSPPCLATRTSR